MRDGRTFLYSKGMATPAAHRRLRLVDARPLTGGCPCGGVRWELTTPPLAASYCHCTRCQRRSGTGASANARVAPGSLRITAGEDLIRSWQPPDGSPKSFCSRCGGALWSKDPATGEIAGVRLGTFDDDPGVRPSYRQYVEYAAVWEPLPEDGLPRYPELRPPDPR